MQTEFGPYNDHGTNNFYGAKWKENLKFGENKWRVLFKENVYGHLELKPQVICPIELQY